MTTFTADEMRVIAHAVKTLSLLDKALGAHEIFLDPVTIRLGDGGSVIGTISCDSDFWSFTPGPYTP